MTEKISRRGVYYDLTISPYEYRTSYGDIYKFSSAKKLELYTRDIQRELERLEKILNRHGLRDFVPDEIIQLLRKGVYNAFYRKIEG